MGGRKRFSLERGIFFHQEEMAPELPDLQTITSWVQGILAQESRSLRSLYYVFLDDAALLEINREYLRHDTYTDIITFPYSKDPIEAEIYISVERVRANAHELLTPVADELLRVMAHGVLHLCGWDDHSEHTAALMRDREDACLALFGVIAPGYVIAPPREETSASA